MVPDNELGAAGNSETTGDVDTTGDLDTAEDAETAAGDVDTAEDPETAAGFETVDTPADVAPGRRVLLFLGIVLAGAALILLAWIAIDLPTCEDPTYAWIPCIGP